MNVHNVTIRIIKINTDSLACEIGLKGEVLSLEYSLPHGEIVFHGKNQLSEMIATHQVSLGKILRSAYSRGCKSDLIIHGVFIDGYVFLKDTDFAGPILLDRREGRLLLTAGGMISGSYHKVYTDGSYSQQTERAGYGGFIEDPRGEREFFRQSFEKGSSNLMELLAVIEGLERLGDCQRLQINTDSRFVIRGLIQWTHFWKHNNWQTAYGRTVKYTGEWQLADSLCEGKLIEFNWIKGHSGHEKQDLCHNIARSALEINGGD